MPASEAPTPLRRQMSSGRYSRKRLSSEALKTAPTSAKVDQNRGLESVILPPQATPEVVSIGNATTGNVMRFQTILAPPG
jgi:hypothetical protein